jgi:SAM-dependent methyltransferase
MELERLKEHWNCFGVQDPLWAIMAHPERKDNGWNISEFFRTGEQWIAELLAEIQTLGLRPAGRCLDFGCGIGRLTQALCLYFDSCDGVDIAPSMIELAQKYNRHGTRCHYHLNDASELRIFPDSTFDLVICIIVLQHIEPLYSKRYIREFLRVLKPGGVAAFQVPSSCIRSNTRPTLGDSGYHARISISCHKLSTHPRQRLTLKVCVRNESTIPWPEHPADGNDFARLNVGNHWLDHSGTMLQLDDGRANLPELRPNEEAIIPLIVTAPARSGRYLLQVDLVEEGVSWFAARGVVAPRIPVRNSMSYWQQLVSRIRRRPRVSDDSITFAPIMEMHCIPTAEVFELVAKAGGRVIHCAKDNAAGEFHESYHYIILKG